VSTRASADGGGRTRVRTALCDLRAALCDLDVDDVAEGLLGVVGDANRAEARLVVEADPLVLDRVPLGCDGGIRVSMHGTALE
jgi:hypothetical protein